MGAAEGVQVAKLPAAIRTRRMTLRRVRLEDAADLFSFACEDIWMRLLPDAQQPYVLRDAERWVARRFLAHWRTEPIWAVEIDGRMVGWVGLNIEPEHGQAELSYAMRPDLRGQGLATEAVRAVVDRVFLDTQLGRVWGRVDPPNVASVRVLEKVGMQREAVMRRAFVRQGELIDLAVYGILRTDWTPRSLDA
ncbi:MAG: GNAT family N-acetyltransferase [Chloroflexi bacterium]|nr:GNAT family N-acetyltransferase [Chloroflexota bacterium]